MVGYTALFIVVFIAVGYVFGSVLFGVLLGRLRGKDPRTAGSMSAGSTNVARTMGTGMGVLTLVLDASKGAAAVAVSYGIFRASEPSTGYAAWSIYAAGFGAVAGHCWPLFFGFRGGKGIATAWGVILLINPPVGAIAIGVWAVIVFWSEYVSLGSVAIAVLAVPLVYMGVALPELNVMYLTDFASGTGFQGGTTAIFAAVAVVVVVRHAKNIGRLLAHNENRAKWPSKIKAKLHLPTAR